ncbi:hypothetical protein [Streptomyces sp. AF1A]|uniref:hypothetical protein n=1 Tax=Streptomyces sp. AF1A TaxID=3394350 RepID=UPI0039BD6ED6
MAGHFVGSRALAHPAFALNSAILFGHGLVTARWSGRRCPAAVLMGPGGVLLGLLVVVANALIK